MKYLLFASLVISLFSCTQEPPEVDSWRLGWRMTFNLMEDKGPLAALQFDSLRTSGEELDYHFLAVGLASLTITDREKEAEAIFSDLSEELKRAVCQSNSVRGASFCISHARPAPTDSLLSRELIQMYINDQAVRGNVMEEVIARYNIQPDSALISLGMGPVDYGNRQRLTEIIAEHGFPTRQLVGSEAMHGVFLIIQHADGDSKWQKAQLPLVEAAVSAGDLIGRDYAYLYDRIQVNSNLPQRYGSQFARVDPMNGIAELAETEDPENLNARRKAMGMMPIEMYRQLILNIP